MSDTWGSPDRFLTAWSVMSDSLGRTGAELAPLEGLSWRSRRPDASLRESSAVGVRFDDASVALSRVQAETESERQVAPMAEAPLTLSSHDELIATIPHILGFKPAESMMCIAIGGGPSARVDLPSSRDEIEAWLAPLTDTYLHTHHPRRIALVAYAEDGPRAVETLARLGDALAEGGPDVGPVLWVKGEEWTELLTATRGTVSPSARTRIDAEFALRGRVMPLDSREELAAGMKGDSRDVGAHLLHTWERFRGLDKAAVHGELGWVGARIDQFREDRNYLSDLDAARVLVTISDTGVLDALMFSTSRADAPVLSELWQDLTRRAPAEVRDAPPTLLAFTSFLEGQGAKAYTALDQLSKPSRLSRLLEAAVQQAVDPADWDERPAPTRGLMQQAALRDAGARDHGKPHEPGINPDMPGPATGR